MEIENFIKIERALIKRALFLIYYGKNIKNMIKYIDNNCRGDHWSPAKRRNNYGK